MDSLSSKYLERVADILCEGRLYLLVGAGVSCRVGIPGWEDLLREFSEEYEQRGGHSPKRAEEIKRFAERKDLELFEVMKNDIQGSIALINVLKKHFYNCKCEDIHIELLGLPLGGVVTTNYDTCFESACMNYGICQELLDKRWFCFPEYDGRTVNMDTVFDGNKFLLHIHGCFCHRGDFEVENIILTPSQYYKFYQKEQMQMILRALAQEHVLLLGTSLTDRYFLDAVRNLRKPKNDNERANTREWFRFCDKGRDCYPLRDEEDLVMYHIHYEEGNDGFANAVREMVNAVDSRKRGVDVYVDTSNINLREDIR